MLLQIKSIKLNNAEHFALHCTTVPSYCPTMLTQTELTKPEDIIVVAGSGFIDSDKRARMFTPDRYLYLHKFKAFLSKKGALLYHMKAFTLTDATQPGEFIAKEGGTTITSKKGQRHQTGNAVTLKELEAQQAVAVAQGSTVDVKVTALPDKPKATAIEIDFPDF